MLARPTRLPNNKLQVITRLLLAVWLVAGGLSAGHAQSPAQGAPTTPTVLLNMDTGNPKLERNKANVLAFYDLMFNRNAPAQAMAQYSGADYRQHNPDVGDGKQAFIDYFEGMQRDYPGKRVEFKRVFADGDYVILHGEHTLPGLLTGGRWAAIDIFRLDAAGKIVEHWDVLQKVPRRSANPNTMF
jgi:predicted SnoaL-like aldol condensation-catalyzing enzyme